MTHLARRWMARGALAGAAAAGVLEARRRMLTWGASRAEATGALPGDELLVLPSFQTTRAVTVHAPPEAVWPWLVQMGQDRAGLYSYDWLENAFGLGFHNADRIVPEWQHLEVGDQIRAAPPAAGPDAGFAVVAVDPGRSIVTAVGDPAKVVPLAEEGPLPEGGTWVFVLRPLDGGRTRLLVRLRCRFGLPPAGEWTVGRLLEPVHFVMERKQLLGIKARAERVPAPAGPPAPRTALGA